MAIEFKNSMKINETFSTYDAIESITKKLVELCNVLGYTEDDTMMLHLAVYEMMVNSVKHGHRYDSSKVGKINGTIYEDRWIISISDEGDGFDYEKICNTSLDIVDIYQTSGRGIPLAKQIVDSLVFENGGRKVTLSSCIGQNKS